MRRVLLPTVVALTALLGPALLGHGARLHAGPIVLTDPLRTAGPGPGELGSMLAQDASPASDADVIAAPPPAFAFLLAVAGGDLFGAGTAPATGGAG